MKKISQLIRQRRSCRTFTTEPLTDNDKIELNRFLQECKTGLDNESIDFSLYDGINNQKTLKLNYGMISGHRYYIFGAVPSTQQARRNYGFLMEQVVLKATAMKIGSCWIGSFDRNYFEDVHIDEGYEIPGIVIVGYAAEKESLVGKLQRFGVKAAKRHDWKDLFFNHHSGRSLLVSEVGRYTEALEMLRLAPSAGNSQPWRVYYDPAYGHFHFFKKPVNPRYDAKGMHDVDLGIAMAHFELAAKETGLHGSWEKQIPSLLVDAVNLQYIATWKQS